jgi:hypothetical protein
MIKKFLRRACAAAVLFAASATTSLAVGAAGQAVSITPSATAQQVATAPPSSMSTAASIWTAVWDVVRNIGQAIASAFTGRGGKTEENARIAGRVLGTAADAAQSSPNPFDSMSDGGAGMYGTSGVGGGTTMPREQPEDGLAVDGDVLDDSDEPAGDDEDEDDDDDDDEEEEEEEEEDEDAPEDFEPMSS